MSLDEIEARLGKLEADAATIKAEITALRKRRRAKLGGLATANRPRARRHTDEEIWAVYDRRSLGKRKWVIGPYGALKDTAEELGITPRTVSRALKRRN
jgi:hypothetical protein